MPTGVFVRTTEHRQNLSNAGKLAYKIGRRGSWNLGLKTPQSVRLKISTSLKNNYTPTEEHKKKESNKLIS